MLLSLQEICLIHIQQRPLDRSLLKSHIVVCPFLVHGPLFDNFFKSIMGGLFIPADTVALAKSYDTSHKYVIFKLTFLQAYVTVP